MGRMKDQIPEEDETEDDAEYVVYRVGGANVESGFLDMAKGRLWDAHVRRMKERGMPVTLTMLARGLTKTQAEAMVRLTKEEV